MLETFVKYGAPAKILRSGAPQEAVEMYSRINKWEKAHRVATEHMTQAEVAMLYITQAHRLESSGKLKEAEEHWAATDAGMSAIQVARHKIRQGIVSPEDAANFVSKVLES